MNCPKCKQKVQADAKFCTNCGTKLSFEKAKQEKQERSVDKYFAEQKKSLLKEAEALAESEMKQGIIWFIGALLVTGATWLFASGGDSYYIFWGAMIYGVYRLVRGFWYKMNPESLLEKAEKKAEKEVKKEK